MRATALATTCSTPLLAVLAASVFLAATASAFSSGPPDLMTGAPGEGTCADCHGNLNVGSGYVNATGPAEFMPGDTLDIFIEVAQAGQTRWGFEMTALDGSDQPVGQMLLIDVARTQLSTDLGTGRQYAKHTSLGTDAGVADTSPGWAVRWASPADPVESVTFYVAGNAANNNSFSSGDFIYTATLHYDSTQTAISESPVTWSRIKSLYR